MRDLTTPLTIMLSGHGTTSRKNLIDNFDDWIYGDQNSRDFKILWLHEREEQDSHSLARESFASLGLDETSLKEYVPRENESYLQAHNRILDDLFLDNEQHDGGRREKAYISVYDPTVDLEAVTRAKEISGTEFVTLNIEGFLDYFEGYETPEVKAEREALEAEQEAAKPSKARRAPRKTAVAPKVAKTLPEPQKVLTEPSSPIVEPIESTMPEEDRLAQKLDRQLSITDLCFPVDSAIGKSIETTWPIIPSAMARLGKDIIDMGNALTRMIEDFKILLDEEK